MAFGFDIKVDNAANRLSFYSEGKLVAETAFSREKPIYDLFSYYLEVKLPGHDGENIFINTSSLKKRTVELLNSDARVSGLYRAVIGSSNETRLNTLKELLNGVKIARSEMTNIDLSRATPTQKEDEGIVLKAITPSRTQSPRDAIRQFEHAADKLKTSTDFFKKAVVVNPVIVSLIPAAVLTPPFAKELFELNPMCFNFIPGDKQDTILSDENSVKKLILLNPNAFKDIPQVLRSDALFQCFAAMTDQNCLHSAIHERNGTHRADFHILPLGISSIWTIPTVMYYPLLQPLNREDAPYREYIHTYPKIGARLQNLADCLPLSPAEKAAIKAHPPSARAMNILCQKASETYSDPALLRRDCKTNGLAYIFAESSLRNDLTIIRDAALKNPEILEIIPPAIKSNRAFISPLLQEIIESDPLNLEFIPIEFQTKPLILQAISMNREAFNFVRGALKNDPEIRTAAGHAPRADEAPRGASAGARPGAAEAPPRATASGGGAVRKAPTAPALTPLQRQITSLLRGGATYHEVVEAARSDEITKELTYRRATGCPEDMDIKKHFNRVIGLEYHPDKIKADDELAEAKLELFKILKNLTE